uniref:Root cap/late embryogenesis-like protein n=1 Tax=Medicago truncatula TaxID=3880 RepID=I3SWQ1_MEDTR|nr:unknown [Medicago truncatula]
MAKILVQILVSILLVLMAVEAASPPGNAKGRGNGYAACKIKKYKHCYNSVHVCPKSCPYDCTVECASCKPICTCDKPGAVCQDPRLIGGDGITFYFHGKKDNNFCLVSDNNLHINAHFIGRRNENMKRDFTWVQSIVILFDNHQLFLGAQKTSTWDDSVDRLALSFDGEPITLNESEGAKWESSGVSFVRETSTNNIIVEVEGNFRITAKVVPITEEDSRIHNYGITKDDCFAHPDLGFKFLSLSNEVNGVLGQTYRPNYVSRVNIGAKMPIMGGGKEYETSSLFSPDCSVARFIGNNGLNKNIGIVENLALPSLSCTSGIDGEGVVCKR